MPRAGLASLLLALGLAYGPPEARASPVENPSLGDAVFTGPAHPHASSVYISPAALGLGLSGHQLYVGGQIRAERVRVDRYDLDLETGATRSGATAIDHPLSGGGELAYTYTGPRISGGISLHTPQTAAFVDAGEPLRYHALGGYHYQAALSGAGAIEISDDFIFGAGLTLSYNAFSLRYDRDTALAGGRDGERGVESECPGGEVCGLEHPAAAQRHDLAFQTGGVGDLFDTRNVALTASLAYQLAQGWWLVGSFMQPPGVFGAVTLQGRARVEPAQRDGGDPVEGDAELSYYLPPTTRLGLRGPIHPDVEAVFGLAYHHASRHDRLDFRLVGDAFERARAPSWQPRYRGLRDAIRASAGLEGEVSRSLRLGARLRADTGTARSSALSPIQVDGPSAAIATGAELRVADALAVTARYEFGWHAPRTADPSAYDPIAALDCADAGYSVEACEAAREGRALSTAAGRYQRIRHAASLSLRYEAL